MSNGDISPDALVQLTKLCALARDYEKLVNDSEQQLKIIKESLRSLLEEDIPQFMAEIGTGIESLALTDGTKISLRDDVYAGIPAARQEEAFQWLEQHGFGGLIKTEVSVVFGRNKAEEAKSFAQSLTENGMEPELNRGVHNQTLRAFLREQLEKAAAVPLELFGARAVRVAKITSPKSPG